MTKKIWIERLFKIEVANVPTVGWATLQTETICCLQINMEGLVWGEDFKPQLQELDAYLHQAILLIAREVARMRYSLQWEQARRYDTALHTAPGVLDYYMWFPVAEALLAGKNFSLARIVEEQAAPNNGSSFHYIPHGITWGDKEIAKDLMQDILQTNTPQLLEVFASSLYQSLGDYIWPVRFSDEETLSANVHNLEWCQKAWAKIRAASLPATGQMHIFITVIFLGVMLYGEFPSQWNALGPVRTVDELKIIQLSAIIRQKSDWRNKLKNPDIIAKWQSPQEETSTQGVMSDMFDFLISELNWFAGQYDELTGIDYATVPGVFISDRLICEEDTSKLRNAVSSFEAEMPFKDWHPNSNDQVLDLVHPSLYPYVRGTSHRLERPAITLKGLQHEAEDVIELLRTDREPPPSNSTPISSINPCGSKSLLKYPDLNKMDPYEFNWGERSKYQWLPVDVAVSSTQRAQSAGPSVKFLSYINNLHPDPSLASGKLYPVLETILFRFIPIFERTLTDTRRYRLSCSNRSLGVRPEFAPDGSRNFKIYWDLDYPDQGGIDSWTDGNKDERQRRYNYYYDNRKYLRPIIQPFVAPAEPNPNAKVTLEGRTIQVIIKLANIELTPEKPRYEGGVWHVEGSDNEHIVATGIYYYESENVSEPTLSFRQCIVEPDYEQFEWEHFKHLYGIKNGEPANQALGNVSTPEGRCICFPNGMQHRLSPIELIDSTKPGHRKILVFFLVDPSHRILSTADVPPQKFEWFIFEVRKRMKGTLFERLPEELIEEIFSILEEDTEGPLIRDEEAKEHRAELMEERSDFQADVAALYEDYFNLCEH